MHVLKDAIARYPEPCEASLLQGLKLLQTVDIRKEIDLIQCPTLRIYGRLDALVPNQAVNAIEALQPKATSVVMEHVSHAPFISDKNNFVQIVRDYLQKS
jgi:pimeloyl-[acyl-carrier protein] methyl ester esterase